MIQATITILVILGYNILNVCHCSEQEAIRLQKLSNVFTELVFKKLQTNNKSSTPLNDLSAKDFWKLASQLGVLHVNSSKSSVENSTISANILSGACCNQHKCYQHKTHKKINSNDLIRCFNYGNTISDVQFQAICPALLYSFLENCDQKHFHEHVHIKPSFISFRQYIYAVACTGIVCLASMIGIFLFPLMPQRYYNSLTSFMSSLAVGTLAGDALLHLIPHAYGLHSHSVDSHDNEMHCHTHNSSDHCSGNYLMKTLVVILGIYLFYLIDVITSKLPGGHEASHHHHHHHRVAKIDPISHTIKKKDQPSSKSLSNYIDEEEDETNAMNAENDSAVIVVTE
ncbi:hypothetical protein GJ496_011582 [Pomphorhynchus laevis]|nr:hypothetical protein GJ496_011582 [Pomphorhynchus laevis]